MPDLELKLPNLDEQVGKVAYYIDKQYLATLSHNYNVQNYEKYNAHPAGGVCCSYADNIRALKLKRFVHQKNEKIAVKFENILGALAGGEQTLGLVLRRTPLNTDVYFVVKNETRGNVSMQNMLNRSWNLLDSALKGNFLGTETERVQWSRAEQGENSAIEQLFGRSTSIASVTNIISDKEKDFLSQGIEAVLEGMAPDEDSDSYTLVILAQPMDGAEIRATISAYESLASAFSPYASHQASLGGNRTLSLSEGSNTFVSNSISVTTGISVSGTVTGKIPFLAEGSATAGAHLDVGYSRGWGSGKMHNETKTEGSSLNHTYTFTSYETSEVIDKLKKQIERHIKGAALGTWKYAAYVLAEKESVSVNTASAFMALGSGDHSFMEPAVLNKWSCGRYSPEDTSDFGNLRKFITHFTHPIFLPSKTRKAEDQIAVTPATDIMTNELAKVMALPPVSLAGLPVFECAAFGREVISMDPTASKDATIEIGNIYHMYHREKFRVSLQKKSLTAHTFITGSTGAGKSNTVYHILNELIKDNSIHFLVVEPAKGEYKDAFGGREDVAVYGTNPQKTKLLRINPFSFPVGEIHVLEHLDRLVEIFNVCWPMYAAMPAILKDACERAYIAAGWDLAESFNPYDDHLFPSFEDVLEQIKIVVNETEYSADTSGDYKGALVTRVKSLTTGINGQIFSADALSDRQLFDENVIVDLSRVGSTETKALLMGLLVMKLQEYRMAMQNGADSALRHVTVLEEAHNLLKRTSTEQSSDSANLLGKSVEMLGNAIAEMRTYGEGFIIADQAPGLMDMAVIRNTNTKIIMRLPDQGDRELVGKAAGLNDDQIKELAKLPMGVAAIYQNEWLAPVLCKIDHFTKKEAYTGITDEGLLDLDAPEITETVLGILTHNVLPENPEAFRQQVLKASMAASLKYKLLQLLDESPEGRTEEQTLQLYCNIAAAFFHAENRLSRFREKEQLDTELVKHYLYEIYAEYLIGLDERDQQKLLTYIVEGVCARDLRYLQLADCWRDGIYKGGMIS